MPRAPTRIPGPAGEHAASLLQRGSLGYVSTAHHFEDFSADLAAWVVFYGPQGDEAPNHS